MVASPDRSWPTLATIMTSAPQRLAATAWLAPLPPNPRSKLLPNRVSPARGEHVGECRQVRVEAADDGDAGGFWHGICSGA